MRNSQPWFPAILPIDRPIFPHFLPAACSGVVDRVQQASIETLEAATAVVVECSSNPGVWVQKCRLKEVLPVGIPPIRSRLLPGPTVGDPSGSSRNSVLTMNCRRVPPVHPKFRPQPETKEPTAQGGLSPDLLALSTRQRKGGPEVSGRTASCLS